jgi:two-component system sensor histidine kinase RegB
MRGRAAQRRASLASERTRIGRNGEVGTAGPIGTVIWRVLARLGWRDAASTGRVRLYTISLYRWLAVIGQLFTLLVVHYSIGYPLPLQWLVPAVALSAAINVGLAVGLRAATRLSERTAVILFAYDIIQLGYLLALTGGLTNPFAPLLVLPLMLGAATLGLGSTIALAVLSIVVVSGLAVTPWPLPWGGPHPPEFPLLYIGATWTALVLTAGLVAAYAWQTAEEARRMSDALAATQLALAREQQLSALGGLAAAAAHELGSPLATIQITASELVHELPEDSPLAPEARDLLEQARRCRDILARIGERRDLAEHAVFTRAPLSSFVAEIAQAYARPGVVVTTPVELAPGLEEPIVEPGPALRHALGNLIDNAIQFARSRATISTRRDAHGVELVIEDDGPGFPPELLEWLGEPFLSTRRDGGGLGLGIFIASTLLARTGASVHFENHDKGARVIVRWPAAAVAEAFTETRHDRKAR